MRKHFLILMLLTLLPLAGWAVDFSDETVTITANNQPFNASATTIKSGITVMINGVPLTNSATPDDKWTWDGKFYTDATGATQKTVATGNTTPDVGTYYIKISAVDGSGNSGYKYVSLIIEKADLVVSTTNSANDYTAPTAVASLTYNGSAKTLITAGKINTTGTGATGSAAKCGSFTYSLSETSGFSTTLPKGTNAATYTVYWKLSGSANYNEVSGFVQVTIGGKDIANLTTSTTNPAWKMTANDSYEYLGTAQAPTFVVKDGNTIITDDVNVVWYPATASTTNNETTYTIDANAVAITGTPVDAGTYAAKLMAKANTNYSGTKTDESWGYTITKKVIQIKIANLNSTYNGQPVTLDNAQIIYPGLCAADAEASVTNFNNQLTVKFSDNQYNTTAPKDVKRNENTSAVEGYGLAIALGNNFNNTALYKNYQIMYTAANATVATASDIDENSIASITATYTIKPVEVSIKPKTIKMEYGANAPTAPTAATVDVAATTTTAAVVGTVEFTDGAMVGTESFLAALQFNVAQYAADADNTVTPNIPAVAWADAVKGPYAGKLTLSVKEVATNEDQTITNARTVANNYAIIFVPGDVEIIGQALTVYAIGGNVQYGSDPADWVFTYEANGLELNGTPNYEIYDLNDNKITDLVNLPRGTYQVKINDADAETLSPDNYTITKFEPGFLVVTKKKITITINPLIVNPGTTQAKLNEYASVDESYKEDLVDPDAKVTFTFAFNADVQNGTDRTLVPYASMNGTALAANARGTYSKGLTATIIEWDSNKTEAQNTAAGWVAANDNYDVTFTGGSLTIVEGGVLYLTQNDAYLLDKINAAATACAATTNPAVYTVTFDNRAVPCDGDEWQAYVLPFDVKVKDLSSKFDYAIINVLDLAKTGATANVNGNKYVYFKLEMNEIKANQPFLMKVYSEGEGQTAEAIAQSKKDKMSKVQFTNVKVKSATATVSVNSKVESVAEFTGLYGQSQLIAKGSTDRFLATKPATATEEKVNQWWTAVNSDYTVKSLEAYLKMASDTENARIFIEDFENGTTAIKELGVDGTAKAYNVDGWYTLNGVKLQGAPTEKGIYINNGKKVVIK